MRRFPTGVRWMTAATFTLAAVMVAMQMGAGCPLNLGRVPACGGAAATAIAGCTVVLDASGSFDPDAGPLAFTWTQTGGRAVVLADSTSSTPSFTVPEVTSVETLTFQVVIRDLAGATDTCLAEVRLVPAPDIDTVDRVCAGDTGLAASTAAHEDVSYAWTIVGGSITSDPNAPAITFDADTGDNVELTVTATGATGCSRSVSRIVLVSPLPTPVITAVPEAVCAFSTENTASTPLNTGSTYAWTIAGGTITAGADTNQISYTAGEGPTVELSVTETTADGCQATATLSVPVNPLPAPVVTADVDPVCAFSTANTASTPLNEGSSYAWTITGGTITVGADTNAIVYTAGEGPTVELSVTETTAQGCFATATRSVTVEPGPAPTITAAATVCANTTGNNASVPLNEGSTYAWTITGGTITAGQNTNAITYTAGGGPSLQLSVTETSADGCVGTGTRTVTVNSAPVITAGPTDQTVQPGDPATFSVTATGASLSHQWQLDEGDGFANLPGETNSTLTIAEASEIPNGEVPEFQRYRVIVSNVCGSVTSGEATLIVTRACCVGGDCNDLTLEECNDADGDFRGPGTRCDDDPDPCFIIP